ncbi:MAG: hypothetical protein PHU01_09370 [Desulfuromonadaceae bacterium]|nr:hypothetical protein [Desulfuromonadaceae bacterium]
MYSVSKQYNKFYAQCDRCQLLFNKINLQNIDDKERCIFLTGILNVLWQTWNGFWRVYWLAFLYGGKDLSNKKIPFAILPKTTNEIDALSYFLTHDRLRSSPLRAYYQEPTWGDIDFIKKCAVTANNIIPTIKYGDPVLNAFSVVGNVPKHFQTVRNAAVHLCSHGVMDVKRTILQHYLITNINYPTDIAYATEISTSKQAMRLWLDDLKTVIEITSITS